MATGKNAQSFEITDVSAGCNYSDDISALKKDQSPDSMNVEFFNGRIRKRKGCVAINVASYAYDADVAYDAGVSYDYGLLNVNTVGYSLMDFSDTRGYHKQVAHVNTTISSFDRLTSTSVDLRTNAPATRSYNTKATSFLIQTYSDYSPVYYWDGAATTMSIMSANAPSFKRAIEFQGYLLGLAVVGAKTRCYYQPIGNIIGTSAAWDQYFTLTPAPNDDEISDPFILNGRLYVGTKNSIFRVSFVGGVTVFEFKQVVSNIGIVPNTAQTVVTKEFGQVVLFLGTDNRVYLFDGANVKSISDLFYYHNQTTPISLDLIDDNYKENSFAVYDARYRIYRLFVTRRAATTNYYCLNIDVDTFAYYPFDNMSMSAGCMCYDGLLRPFLVCLNYEGQLVKMFISNNTDYGTPINEYYTSPLVSIKKNALVQGNSVNMRIVPSSKNNLIVEDRVNNTRAWERCDLLPLCSPKDKTLGVSAVLGSAKLGSDKVLLNPMVSVAVTFNQYQLKIYCDNNTAKPWEIYDIGIDQSVLKMGQSEPQR